MSKRRLAKPWRAGKKNMVQRFIALFGGLNKDLKIGAHLRLAHKFRKPLWPKMSFPVLPILQGIDQPVAHRANSLSPRRINISAVAPSSDTAAAAPIA